MRLKPSLSNDIKNIIFDFGNVLLDIDISITTRAFSRMGLKGLRSSDIHPHNAGVFLDLELGNITTDQFVAELQAYAPEGAAVPTRDQILAAWNALLLPYDFRRFEMLDSLRESGYNVYLLSNTNLPHREYFVAKFDRENPANAIAPLRPFESYFDHCFYSDAMHLRKPDPKIYTTTLEYGNMVPSQTLFIDDNKHNTEAASRLGINTYHLANGKSVLDLFE